ncbi:MAG: hypothetical protein WBA16_05220 [Nonlabens sp.]
MNFLLEKYWNGDTTLEEEQKLRDYFNSGAVDPAHEIYNDLFAGLESESVVEQDYEFDAFARLSFNHSERHEHLQRWKGIAIAAGFALMIAVGAGTYNLNQQPDLGSYDNPEEAYAATMDALQLISTKFNNGRENLAPAVEVGNKTSQIFKLNNK